MSLRSKRISLYFKRLKSIPLSNIASYLANSASPAYLLFNASTAFSSSARTFFNCSTSAESFSFFARTASAFLIALLILLTEFFTEASSCNSFAIASWKAISPLKSLICSFKALNFTLVLNFFNKACAPSVTSSKEAKPPIILTTFWNAVSASASKRFFV